MRNFEHENEIIRRIQEHAAKVELQQRILELEAQNQELKEEKDHYETLYGIAGFILFIVIYAIVSHMEVSDALR